VRFLLDINVLVSLYAVRGICADLSEFVLLHLAFVTRDAQLLALGSVDAMRVVTPRQFWELLHAGDPGTGST